MENQTMKFVSNKLNIPIFINNRNRIKKEESIRLNKHLEKNVKLYTKKCIDENKLCNETTTIRKYKHNLGIDPFRIEKKPCEKRALPISRNLTKVNDWQMAPNRYNIESTYYDDRKGLSGAYWKKKPTSQKRAVPPKPYAQKFVLPKLHVPLVDPFNVNGSLSIDMRKKKPTTRFMVSNLVTCHKEPTWPHAATYTITAGNFGSKKPKPLTYVPNEYLFYRYTTIPERKNVIYTPNTASLPGVGRYENRFRNVCTCFGSKFIYETDLQRLIDINKRNKFRRKPFKKIKISNYCSPEYRHIKGNGFRYLFKTSVYAKKMAAAEKKKAAKGRLLKVRYADARYIHTINNPFRAPISFRINPLPKKSIKIHYNTMEKRIIRKQLRTNKKIAFGSGKERFPDDQKISSVAKPPLREILKRLPPEKRIRNYPVMTVPPSTIQAKYLEPIKRPYSRVEITLRKREFKFPPLPEAKILCRPSAFALTHSPYKAGFYTEKIKAEDYFK